MILSSVNVRHKQFPVDIMITVLAVECLLRCDVKQRRIILSDGMELCEKKTGDL